jgi:TrmH family RNA methyltransferase
MKRPHVVIVKPIYPLNIGYVARVMANMGGDRLILIAPKCEINHESRLGAAGAQQRLVESTIYSSWDDFFESEPEGFRLAFHGKEKQELDATAYADRLQLIHTDQPEWLDKPHYLIFGTEDKGLSDDDLRFANYIFPLPTYGEFKSMNLSHAVMLALFIYQDAGFKYSANKDSTSPPATTLNSEERFFFPEETIQDWLKTLGFDLGSRDRDAYTVLKRLLLQRLASAKELRMLEAIIQQTVRKLKNR